MIARRSPSAKVAAVSVLLLIGGLSLLLAVPAVESTSASWTYFVVFSVAFSVSERTVFHLEIRRQAHTFSLAEAVIVIGLFLVQPWLLVIARLVGALTAMVTRRLAPIKIGFNLCLALAETALSATILAGAFGISDGAIAMSVGAILAVAASDIFGVVAVFVAIAIFEGRPRRRQVLDVLQAQMFVTIIMGSVGVVGSLALASGAWTSAYLAIFAFGTITVFRKYAQLTMRHRGLQTLHDFSRAIADDLNYVRVLQIAMRDLGDILSATSVLGVVFNDSDFAPAGVYRIVDGELAHERFIAPVEEFRVLAGGEPVLRDAQELSPGVRTQLGLEQGQVLSGDLTLREVDEVVFVATKGADAVNRFDESSVEQTAAMARYVSATLKNGLMVEEIDRASRRDGLTGLANRFELERRIAAEAAPMMGVVVVSMDDLGEINDTLGHAVGDEVVKELANRLATAATDSMVVARLDGASLAAVYTGLSIDEMAARATQLVEKLDGELHTEWSRVDVRCVAGVAVDSDGTDPANLIRWADLALSEARRTGSPVGKYSQDLDDAQHRRLQLVGNLRRAIAMDDFELWYQPKLALDTGQVAGAEALIRWIHDDHGFIAPDEFIGLAETTGLIGEVTQWVLSAAIRQRAEWADQYPDLEVAVNLSAVDLVDPTLVRTIEQLLLRHGVTEDKIGLEVTETAMMRDRDQVIATLAELRENGHRVYVDDYGTGQSSLAYLKSLPVDALKIDRAFIANLAEDADDEVIVRNTIALAHQLNLAVVAEGIEEEGALSKLRELGCEYAQGYFMARPMRPEDFEAWMEDVETLRSLLGYEGESPAAPSESETAAEDTKVARPAETGI